MSYCKQLTKQELLDDGINVEITDTIKVFRNGKEIIPHKNGRSNYLVITVYKRDSNGNRIKVYTNKPPKYAYEVRTIGLHRVIWAFRHNEVPEGKVVDHISNKHDTLEDYMPDNLQLLTPMENLTKDTKVGTSIYKANMKQPRAYYEEKIQHYIELVQMARINNNSKLDHHYRSCVANNKAKLRYWDLHKEEYDEYIKGKNAKEKEYIEYKQKKADFKGLIFELESIITYARKHLDRSIWHNRVRMRKCLDNPEVCNLIDMIYESEVNKYEDKQL